VTPLPVAGTDRFALEAVLTIVKLPVTLAAPCGLNWTVNVVLCPALSVTGSVRPLIVNPVPLVVT